MPEITSTLLEKNPGSGIGGNSNRGSTDRGEAVLSCNGLCSLKSLLMAGGYSPRMFIFMLPIPIQTCSLELFYSIPGSTGGPCLDCEAFPAALHCYP